LNHENVVKIKAVLADQGIIIMEFIKEGSLDRYVHSHRDQLRSVFSKLFLFVIILKYQARKITVANFVTIKTVDEFRYLIF